MNDSIVVNGRHLYFNQYGNPEKTMKDKFELDFELIQQLEEEYAAVTMQAYSDELLTDISNLFDNDPDQLFITGSFEVTEGQVSRIRVERNGVEIANLSFELVPGSSTPRRQPSILIVGADRTNVSLLAFERQAEMLGIHIEHISSEGFYGRSWLKDMMSIPDRMQTLVADIKEVTQHFKTQEKLAANIANGSSKFQDKGRNVHGQEAKLGYKVHGSRRGRNIRDDQSRKAQYSKSRK